MDYIYTQKKIQADKITWAEFEDIKQSVLIQSYFYFWALKNHLAIYLNCFPELQLSLIFWDRFLLLSLCSLGWLPTLLTAVALWGHFSNCKYDISERDDFVYQFSSIKVTIIYVQVGITDISVFEEETKLNKNWVLLLLNNFSRQRALLGLLITELVEHHTTSHSKLALNLLSLDNKLATIRKSMNFLRT